MITRVCTACGEEFTVQEYVLRHRKREFCSRVCFRTFERSPTSRFWPHVQKTKNCWVWTGALSGNRHMKYGSVTLDVRDSTGAVTGRRTVKAHRLSWEIHHGVIPDGLHALHKCDNPLCVNPEHLWLGTIADNMADRDAKNRQARHSRQGRAKLTIEAAATIRAKRARGATQVALAEEYNVSRATIRALLAGKTWRRP